MSITRNQGSLDHHCVSGSNRRVVVTVNGATDNSSVRRIRAVDLQMATAAYNEVRCNGDSGSVLLDVEILLAPTARDARIAYRDLALAPRDARSNFLYVGTPSGLAGLVSDIGAARVADGVTLIPLDDPATVKLLVSAAIPHLVRADTIDGRTAESLTDELTPARRQH
ncbi:hypothetical protein GCM10007304_45710 [Rhodococcoides trifolii]|uniref:Uncharacterized protein n=1 Tax=Rhodococcoides trifolii TaxID=908250 RepID=A0A917LIK6_9NOCA|nr:hypothetical protein [Rhodococcus trifolii]GGG26784.1 hypothetical protein GCM10007304_45710 [Rhodococcus trifolii]